MGYHFEDETTSSALTLEKVGEAPRKELSDFDIAPRLALREKATTPMGAIKANRFRSKLKKAWNASDLDAFEALMSKPGAALVASKMKVDEGDEYLSWQYFPEKTLDGSTKSSSWIEAMARAGLLEVLDDKRREAVAKNLMAFDAANPLCLQLYKDGCDPLTRWSGYSTTRDPLCVAAAQGAHELSAFLAKRAYECFLEGDDRAVPSLTLALEVARESWESTRLAKRSLCLEAMEPWLAKVSEFSKGHEPKVALGGSSASSGEAGAALGGGTSEQGAAPPEFMKLILEEMRSMRSEISELKALVESSQHKPDFSERFLGWRSGRSADGARPEKTPGEPGRRR